jgi:hypothetical protein
MSSTPDWMRHREDDPQGPIRLGPPLGAVVIWILGLVMVALAALAVLQPFG